jgi:hypothetical protein
MSRQPPTVQIVIDQEHPESVEYFSCLGSMTTNGAIRTLKLNPGLLWKSVFEQEEHFHQKIRLIFKEEISKMLHLE